MYKQSLDVLLAQMITIHIPQWHGEREVVSTRIRSFIALSKSCELITTVNHVRDPTIATMPYAKEESSWPLESC